LGKVEVFITAIQSNFILKAQSEDCT
jgi:hypothetical protein